MASLVLKDWYGGIEAARMMDFVTREWTEECEPYWTAAGVVRHTKDFVEIENTVYEYESDRYGFPHLEKVNGK